MYRTHNCGELRKKDVEKEVILSGWVDRIRDLGGIKFIILRDRYGKTQLVVNPNSPAYEISQELGREWVIQVYGKVLERPDETKTEMVTGEIEVEVNKIKVLSKSDVPPFYPGENVSEDLRLKYRYIDLRDERMQKNLIIRHKMAQAAREFLNKHDFLEVETPYLTKSTPEGARDFLVPSRLQKGKFYALPQSPQLFKQILMVSGFDRYYQFARCFRDEDLRADRQPEFTQIDIEMSFVKMDEILDLMESFARFVFGKVGIKLPEKFDRLSYEEAMELYGSDKPDRRYGMQLQDFTNYFVNTEFKVIKNVLERSGSVKGFITTIPISRKIASQFEEFVKQYGLGGLLWFKLDDEIVSPTAKFLKESYKKIVKEYNLDKGSVVLLAAHENREILNTALGALRLKVGKEYFNELEKVFDALWIVDFPFLEWNEEESRFEARHHPFTMPKNLEQKLEDIKAYAYDMILNGMEIGGGSIRIHDSEVQKRVFEIIGLTEEEANEKFGFFISALKYGVPPHGGIAFGFDRMVSIAANVASIRDVIAFPKTSSGICQLTGAPSTVEEKQLKELSIQIFKGGIENERNES
ncbi:aspartyl-tRNA synthetase [Thermosipho melanesiensis]|uniref:Aspartate--tRNA ligase n=2 Tax=Thermosipho melanesiensis TaxID=46541 RepID=SYD_THEM4|nr:aspartate--tRNA ligase [Thermosipho melanesiensis]A6LNG3.1 RecName: Full=Aspartate--tRNA ligase; AltName: Full=Aspartyl-tRNA synthetase; Short=AspRS [Thermosipho melanesiensis BI429]ABR31464.1 aspartyl-tRNA synthetase [Thermosipho melanesiensis BI429]APT74522.1 aspartyl-tRNA synthetase [Thermosipho melanesiensis]OOC36809.1 aspartyl-tRNA synthetase [Thermosipho melanesiensis]OOC37346.1 aspartyl-tRNA synthetase [Thermosipho melanesiensis]OOC38045.1 aspartyl-tRNA synthetase [Thermosipho melan